MSILQITVACPPYDRNQPLINGTVVPDGIDMNFLQLEVEEIFWRQLVHGEFDVSECSLSSYTMLRSKGDNRFIAIPVFPSRFFRHSCVFINKNKGITCPQDLKGKLIGVPEYQMTAPVWIRGIFQDEYGVFPRDIDWRCGGEETPGRVDKVPMNLPSDIRLKAIPEDKTLSQMLDNGEIDALYTARTPSCFTKGSPNVDRLFPNFREVEEDYFRRTGIFPMMHTIVIKREVYEKNRWMAMSLFKAFSESKEIALDNFSRTEALYTTMPWIISEAERTRSIMGSDWWPYGVAKNRKALEAFLRYHHEQGLSGRLVSIEELFAPETMDEFKI